MEYLELGSSPYDEDCAQVGSPDYYERVKKECRVYLNQLRRQYGEEPEGAKLSIKSFNHDFGSYYEVICYYKENNRISEKYAYTLEDGCAKWDKEALKELKGILINE
jgi:hypothetical protein